MPTILVLGRGGYKTAVKGSNNFVCLVDRSWMGPFADPEFWNPKVRPPTCFNPHAARLVLPVHLKRTELVLARLSKSEMEARIKAAFEKKELILPEPGAMAYMMSKEQYLSDSDPTLPASPDVLPIEHRRRTGVRTCRTPRSFSSHSSKAPPSR